MSDAKATVRTVIISGIAERAHLTGLRTGPTVDLLVEDLLESLFRADVRWAVRAYADERDQAEEVAAFERGVEDDPFLRARRWWWR